MKIPDIIFGELSFIKRDIVFGIDTIDNDTELLKRGHLHLVGGSSGVGKTSIILNLALENSRRNKESLFLSSEISSDNIMERLDSMSKQYKNTRNYKDTFTGTIMVKETDDCTANEISWFNQLQNSIRKTTDIIIIDGLGRASRNLLSNIYNLAVAYNCCIVGTFNAHRFDDQSDGTARLPKGVEICHSVSLLTKDYNQEITLTIVKNRATGECRRYRNITIK